MIDIKFLRENPDVVKENIKKKFQDKKLPLVDEVYEKDIKYRELNTKGDELRSKRNSISSSIGELMRNKQVDEANAKKQEVVEINNRLIDIEKDEEEKNVELKKRMMVIPNIIDPSVPIGKDDSENKEVEKFGEPIVPDFEVPYHADIMASLNGIDKDSAGRTSGNSRRGNTGRG